MNLDIVYEDKHLLVLYKPAGVPVQSGKVGVPDCVSMLKNYLYNKAPEKGAPYLGVVHRLDQPVEGLVVFALTPEAAADLSRQAAGEEMEKRYLAVCRAADGAGNARDLKHFIVDNSVENPCKASDLCGKKPPNVEKVVEKWTESVDFLVKKPKSNRAELVPEGTCGAKRAVLYYRVLEEREGAYLLEIRLGTGRFHQIRVQMAGMGYPLFGDRKYGKVDNYVDNFPLALCAYRLRFRHPVLGKSMEFQHFPANSAFKGFGADLCG